MSGKYFKILFAVNVLVLALFTALIFFALPSADDFHYAYKAVTNDPFYLMKYEYTHWAARYFQVLLTSVWFGYILPVDSYYWVGILFYAVMFFLGIFILARALNGYARTLPVWLGAFFVFTLTLRGMPTLDETIYWHIGSVTYIFSTTMFLCAAALCLTVFRNREAVWWRYLLLFFLIVASGGSLEVMAPLTLLLMLFFLLAAIIEKQKIRFYLYGMAVTLMPTIAILLCPGKGTRMTIFKESGKLLPSIVDGAGFFFKVVLQSSVDPVIWLSLIFLFPMAVGVYRQLRGKYNLRLLGPLYAAIYLVGLYSIMAFHYYATGTPPVYRLLSTWYILYLAGLFPLLICAVPLLLHAGRFVRRIVKRKIRINKKYLLPVLIFYVISLLCLDNPPKAVEDLLYNVVPLHEEYRGLQEDVRRQAEGGNTAGKTLMLYNFTVCPKLLKTPDTVDYSFGVYYGFKRAEFRDKPVK